MQIVSRERGKGSTALASASAISTSVLSSVRSETWRHAEIRSPQKSRACPWALAPSSAAGASTRSQCRQESWASDPPLPQHPQSASRAQVMSFQQTAFQKVLTPLWLTFAEQGRIAVCATSPNHRRCRSSTAPQRTLLLAEHLIQHNAEAAHQSVKTVWSLANLAPQPHFPLSSHSQGSNVSTSSKQDLVVTGLREIAMHDVACSA